MFHPVERSGDLSAVRSSGFTLIEMMIVVALIAVMAVLAVPAFTEFREKSVVRSAAEDLVTLVANARFEAIKRNRVVDINFRTSGAAFCAGARTRMAAAFVACDCFEVDPTVVATYCDVGQFPALDPAGGDGAAQALVLLKRARRIAAIGDGTFSFDPKLGVLDNLGDAPQQLTIGSPTDSSRFRLDFRVNALGRATLCSTASYNIIPGYPVCP